MQTLQSEKNVPFSYRFVDLR